LTDNKQIVRQFIGFGNELRCSCGDMTEFCEVNCEYCNAAIEAKTALDNLYDKAALIKTVEKMKSVNTHVEFNIGLNAALDDVLNAIRGDSEHT